MKNAPWAMLTIFNTPKIRVQPMANTAVCNVVWAPAGTVIDSNNGQGTNALGFIGTVNFFRRFGGWQTSGAFSYAQNVQTLLVTYTTSYYNYSANLHRKLPIGITWSSSFGTSPV